MASNPSGPADPSRRKMLKALVVVAAGGCVAFLGSGLLRSMPSNQNDTSTSAPSTVMPGQGGSPYSRIKVRYFQMSSTLPGVSEEYFIIPNPATYGQLLGAVVAAHPVLAAMVSSMLVLIDGAVAKAGTALKEGDEVDFIPAISGG
jgi:molybdopterin converting factor small subunit